MIRREIQNGQLVLEVVASRRRNLGGAGAKKEEGCGVRFARNLDRRFRKRPYPASACLPAARVEGTGAAEWLKGQRKGRKVKEEEEENDDEAAWVERRAVRGAESTRGEPTRGDATPAIVQPNSCVNLRANFFLLKWAPKWAPSNYFDKNVFINSKPTRRMLERDKTTYSKQLAMDISKRRNNLLQWIIIIIILTLILNNLTLANVHTFSIVSWWQRGKEAINLIG